MKGITLQIALLFCFAFTTMHSSAQNNMWVQKANFGGNARTVACGFGIGDSGYILTGQNGSFYNDVWAFDTATNTWTQKPNFPGVAREGAAAVSLNGKGYVIGGKTGSGFVGDVWEYTPATGTWTAKTSFIGAARYYAICVADPANNKIYYGTGDKGVATYLTDWYVFDPIADSWSALSAFPGGQRSYGVGFCINGTIYAGTGNGNGGAGATNDWWSYNTGTDTWLSVAAVPGNARRDACTFVIGNRGYICLGINGNTGEMSDLYMYDAVANLWTAKANYGAGIASCAVAFTLGHSGFVGTGLNASSANTSQFWEFIAPNPAGIDEVNAESKNVNVYPNPNNGVFQIQANSQIEVYNMLGEKIANSQWPSANSQMQINLSSQAAGIYLYRVISENGNLVGEGKLVIER